MMTTILSFAEQIGKMKFNFINMEIIDLKDDL